MGVWKGVIWGVASYSVQWGSTRFWRQAGASGTSWYFDPTGTLGGSAAKCSSACWPRLLGIHRSGHLLIRLNQGLASQWVTANRLRYLSITLNTTLKLSVQRKVSSCLIWKWLLDTWRIFMLMMWCISSTHYLTINRCCRYELALDLSLTWLRVQFVITPASQPTLHSCKSQLGVKQKINENNIFKQKKKKKPCWFKWEACSSHILFLSQLKRTKGWIKIC